MDATGPPHGPHEAAGLESYVVNDLTTDDLPAIAWSGTPRHVQAVAEVIARAERGETEYLAVRADDGAPVSIGGIDYTGAPGVGTIFQLSTDSALRGLGLGSKLIAVAEDRIRQRGLTVSRVGVEDDNRRARALYERLGYKPVARRRGSWETQRDDGTLFMYETVLTEMDKSLL